MAISTSYRREGLKEPLEPGGPGRRRMMLLVDPVGALALVGFQGLHGVPGLLHCAGHEPANGMFLPAHLVDDLGQGSAVLALEHGNDLGSLAALARSLAPRVATCGTSLARGISPHRDK